MKATLFLICVLGWTAVSRAGEYWLLITTPYTSSIPSNVRVLPVTKTCPGWVKDDYKDFIAEYGRPNVPSLPALYWPKGDVAVAVTGTIAAAKLACRANYEGSKQEPSQWGENRWSNLVSKVAGFAGKTNVVALATEPRGLYQLLQDVPTNKMEKAYQAATEAALVWEQLILEGERVANPKRLDTAEAMRRLNED